MSTTHPSTLITNIPLCINPNNNDINNNNNNSISTIDNRSETISSLSSSASPTPRNDYNCNEDAQQRQQSPINIEPSPTSSSTSSPILSSYQYKLRTSSSSSSSQSTSPSPQSPRLINYCLSSSLSTLSPNNNNNNVNSNNNHNNSVLSSSSSETLLYKGQHIEVVKIDNIIIKRATDEQYKDYIRRELQFYKVIGNQSFYTIKCLNNKDDDENCVIRLPYMQLETLNSVLTNNKYVYVDTIINFLRNILRGILELHRLGITHGDLKPDNLFVDDQYNIKIGDFGAANKIGIGHIETYTTGFYPFDDTYLKNNKEEILKRDVYAFGAIVYYIFTKTPIAEGKNILKSIPNNWPIKYRNLLGHCLVPPYKTMEEIADLWERIPYNDHCDMYSISQKYNTRLFNRAKNLRLLPTNIHYKFPSLGKRIIKQIDQAFNTKSFVVLYGISGMGKTALAYKYSLQVDNHQNRTPIWVNNYMDLQTRFKEIKEYGKGCSFLIVWDGFGQDIYRTTEDLKRLVNMLNRMASSSSSTNGNGFYTIIDILSNVMTDLKNPSDQFFKDLDKLKQTINQLQQDQPTQDQQQQKMIELKQLSLILKEHVKNADNLFNNRPQSIDIIFLITSKFNLSYLYPEGTECINIEGKYCIIDTSSSSTTTTTTTTTLTSSSSTITTTLTNGNTNINTNTTNTISTIKTVDQQQCTKDITPFSVDLIELKKEIDDNLTIESTKKEYLEELRKFIESYYCPKIPSLLIHLTSLDRPGELVKSSIEFLEKKFSEYGVSLSLITRLKKNPKVSIEDEEAADIMALEQGLFIKQEEDQGEDWLKYSLHPVFEAYFTLSECCASISSNQFQQQQQQQHHHHHQSTTIPTI